MNGGEEMGIVTTPLYNPGSVIDLGHKFGEHMPNRIKINMVYQKENSPCWMYEVFSEMHNGATYLKEDDIAYRISQQTSSCYDLDIIKKRYKRGYRFCGNYGDFIAKSKAEKMKDMKEISSIVLYPAIDKNGKKMKKDMYGLWVKYNTSISNTGFVECEDEGIIIK
jgi:hypothetical protein